MLTWWQALPPLLLLVCAAVLAVRHRNLLLRVRAARRELGRQEERLLGSLALAEETVHRILRTAEIGTTIRRVAVDSVELLDLAGARIELDPEAISGLEAADARVQHGSCEGENTQRLPIRARGREIGSLWFTPREGRPLGIRELHFLRLLANLTGIGIENLLFHREVVAANDDKRRFILATTHDLRAPMSAVEQIVTVLLDGYAGPLADKQRAMLEKVRARSAQQLELLTDLLNLAAELDGFAILRESERVDFGEIFDRQGRLLRGQCEAAGIECSIRRTDRPLWCTAVPSDLENILGNLLSNAVKYTPPPGRIEATLEAEDGQCRLRVADTGIGIPEASLPDLFREYHRAPNARELTRHGTGLGLALVRQLVRKYGGRIRVESRLHEGSTFEVTLPLESDDAARG